MNFRIRSGLVCWTLLAGLSAVGQNDFFFNHYMLNPSYYNPAWVGIEGEAFVAGHHRSQWSGYSSSFDGTGGAPSSQLVSFVVPSEGPLSGFGLSVSNDQVANLSNLQARFSFSVARDFRFGKISVGLMPTMFSQSLDFGQLRPVEPEPGILQGRASQVRPDLSAGLYLKSNRNYFIGFSVINLLKPTFDYGTQLSAGGGLNHSIASSYLISAGTSLGILRDWVLKPTTLIRTDFNSYSFELSGMLVYQDKAWGGLSFRRLESITLLLGYSFLPNGQLKFGYSFDYTIHDREAKAPTSHEIYIRYDLPNLMLGGRKPVKTPRFNF